MFTNLERLCKNNKTTNSINMDKKLLKNLTPAPSPERRGDLKAIFI